jgi:hypothetical protein
MEIWVKVEAERSSRLVNMMRDGDQMNVNLRNRGSISWVMEEMEEK